MAKRNTTRNTGFNFSTGNLIVGALVVLIIIGVVIGIIRGRNLPGQTTNQTTEQNTTNQQTTSLPTKHTVAQGEDLWKISEKYYGNGYNWVDIASENNLTNNPNAISTGMELSIPNVTPKIAQEPTKAPETAQATPTPQEMAKTSSTDSATTNTTQAPSQTTGSIPGGSYTVQKGDYLWEIAVRAYGDGYKWIDIARANKLVNPNVIHSGNSLTLPR